MQALGIYVHIPFCSSKCNYCDFFSIVKKLNQKEENLFFQRIKADLETKKKYIPNDTRPLTLYFGGGTPSSVSPDLIKEITELIKSFFGNSWKSIKEITLEANPESIDADKLDKWIKIGINRIHLGVQSANPLLLKYLGRNAFFEEAEKALQILHDSPINNYGADMIYGIYSQKFTDLRTILNLFINYKVRHVSAYTLTLHEGTRLHEEIKNGSKRKASVKKDYYHDIFIEKELKKAGFYHYEISNYAQPGFESAHNTLYWKYRPYLGLGPSAHSFLLPYRIENPYGDTHFQENIEKGTVTLSEKEIAFQKKRKIEERDTFFEREDPKNMHIGLYRYGKYQSFSAFRHFSLPERLKTMNKLKILEKKRYLQLFSHGFRLSPRGLRWNDDIVEFMLR